MAGLAISLVLAVVLGFAAHRASVCTVRAVAEAMHSKTAFMFASIGKSVLWILVFTLPVFWLVPSTAASLAGWQLNAAAVAGGFLFGLGAGLNGACAYSTMARLVDGEVAMIVAIVGFAVGVGVFVELIDFGWLQRPANVSPMIATVIDWGGILSAILVVWAIYEAIRLWRTRPRGKDIGDLVLSPKYRLSSAALLIGLSGSAIFLLFGSAGYTSTFELVIEGALGTRPWPIAGRWFLLLAVLFGMLLSTIQRGAFRADWRPRAAWLRNLGGGMLMGLGAAMAPGGNDTFVLYGVPNLSPNALPAYAAMTLGIVAALLIARSLFGIVARVACKDDVFVSDTWTPEGTRPTIEVSPAAKSA
jgi:uncharacterized membrane protein YedE/YeeE